MNIHGKNNYAVGTMGDAILEFDIVLPDGEVVTASREQNADLFHAAIGGFGMLGSFSRIVLRTKKVYSGNVSVKTVPTRTLREMMDEFERRKARADYLVGWIDCFPGGNKSGRGVIHEARYLQPGEDGNPEQTLKVSYQELPPNIAGVVPKSEMWRFLRLFNNDTGMRFINFAKYLAARMEGEDEAFLQSHAGFAFLLDYVPNWKWAYGRDPGRKGLIQFQSFLPHDTAHDTYIEMLARCRRAGIVSYLGVLKRHRPDPFWLTHAVDGWSFAMDFPVTPANRAALWALCDELTEQVLAAGGRFYFAKDLVIGQEDLLRYVPADRLARFVEMKRELDPDLLLQTNLFRRVFGGSGVVRREFTTAARCGRVSGKDGSGNRHGEGGGRAHDRLAAWRDGHVLHVDRHRRDTDREARRRARQAEDSAGQAAEGHDQEGRRVDQQRAGPGQLEERTGRGHGHEQQHVVRGVADQIHADGVARLRHLRDGQGSSGLGQREEGSIQDDRVTRRSRATRPCGGAARSAGGGRVAQDRARSGVDPQTIPAIVTRLAEGRQRVFDPGAALAAGDRRADGDELGKDHLQPHASGGRLEREIGGAGARPALDLRVDQGELREPGREAETAVGGMEWVARVACVARERGALDDDVRAEGDPDAGVEAGERAVLDEHDAVRLFDPQPLVRGARAEEVEAGDPGPAPRGGHADIRRAHRRPPRPVDRDRGARGGDDAQALAVHHERRVDAAADQNHVVIAGHVDAVLQRESIDARPRVVVHDDDLELRSSRCAQGGADQRCEQPLAHHHGGLSRPRCVSR
jgi:FAD/FMN-containing dehydrogenase